jgi:hypothetical protein
MQHENILDLITRPSAARNKQGTPALLIEGEDPNQGLVLERAEAGQAPIADLSGSLQFCYSQASTQAQDER